MDDLFCASPADAMQRASGTGAGVGSGHAILQQAQRLKALAERIEFFLQQQSRKLDSRLTPTGDVPHDPRTLKQLMVEFERVRQQWEQQRQQEQERIQHDSARLVEAWRKLESEQRRLLAERQAAQVSGGAVALPAAVIAACSGEASPIDSAAPVQHGRPAQPPIEHHQSSSAELSMLEFQQLKREVQRHGRNQR